MIKKYLKCSYAKVHSHQNYKY